MGSRERQIHILPKTMSPQEAVCLDPAHFALAAVRDANVRIGTKVAIFGLGAIGLIAVQMVKLSGAELVFASDPLSNLVVIWQKNMERANYLIPLNAM